MNKPNKNPRGRVGSLSTDVREYLCTTGKTPVAMLLDALYHVGVSPNTELSIPEAINKLSDLPLAPLLIRRALKYPVFRKTRKQETEGRPAQVFMLPSPAQVAMWYNLSPDGRQSDDLPMWAFESPKHYRKALHFALIVRYTRQHDGVRKSAQWFANRLGVSKRTVRRYNRELKEQGLIDYYPNITEEPIQKTDVFWSFPADRAFDCWMRGVNPAGQSFEFPGIRELACKLSAAGWKIFKRRQHCNTYVALI